MARNLSRLTRARPTAKERVTSFVTQLIINKPYFSVPGLTTPKSYGFALRNGDPHVGEISLGILHLRDSGFIEKLRNKYWSMNIKCSPRASNNNNPGETVTVTIDKP